jgi:gas vesicle protein
MSRPDVSPERSIAAMLTGGIISAAAALRLALLLISP